MNHSKQPKRITLVDVARKAHVSRATASLVIRGSPLVADVTRERVLAAMEDLGYVYNRAAASLRTQRSSTVGLIVTDLTNPFFAQMTVGIQTRFEAEGYALLLANSADTLSRQNNLIEAMYARGVDGVLLCPARGSGQELLEQLRLWQLPTVFVARYIKAANSGTTLTCDYVGADNENGAFQAVEYLINAGHRSIAFIGGPEDSSARDERLLGYYAAMQKHNLAGDDRWIIPSPVTREGGYAAVDELMGNGILPTAFVCYNDVIAFGAMLRMQADNIHPGVDVAVIGFDNIAEAALWQPALSTVSITPQRMGEQAAELLLARMRNPDRQAQQTILPAQLIIRHSSDYSEKAN